MRPIRPRPPGSLDELGVPVGLAEDLFLRRVLTDRVTTIGGVARDIHVIHRVAEELASALREKQLIEYLGATGRDYRIQLTELGSRTTTQRMAGGRHIGGIPVPLDDYRRVVSSQQIDPTVSRDVVARAFADLVVGPDLIDQIGPAFLGDGALFLYGPAGTGKTSIAERLNRIVDDPVLVPRHIEVDGQIVMVFDPAIHRPVDPQPEGVDPRWVLCQRPLVVVGGELDRAMLDLQFDNVTGANAAPVTLLANNGILVVDDFGRQAITPDVILNRWIVPLSRGIDFLKAGTGTKFTVPFAVKLVISTNLDPADLGDDAFLRRLRNKVYVGPIGEAEFLAVVDRVTAARGIQLAAGAAQHLCAVAYQRIGELRPYLAVDFCDLAEAACRYHQMPMRLEPDLIDRLANLYFVRGSAPQPFVERRHGSGEDWEGPERRRSLQRWGAEHAPAPRQPPRRWAEYEIAAHGAEDPLAGLDVLADTQIVDDDDQTGEIPAALWPVGDVTRA